MGQSRTSGFTLIELLITIAIIGIIAAMAAPSFQAQIAKRKMENEMHKLEMCFKDSQLQAIMYNKPVTVRLNNGASSSQLTCGSKAPITLDSKITLGSDVDVTTTFAPNRQVYTNYTGKVLVDDTKQTSANKNNVGFQFCISGQPQNTLMINSRGMVTVNPFGEGGICN